MSRKLLTPFIYQWPTVVCTPPPLFVKSNLSPPPQHSVEGKVEGARKVLRHVGKVGIVVVHVDVEQTPVEFKGSIESLDLNERSASCRAVARKGEGGEAYVEIKVAVRVAQASWCSNDQPSARERAVVSYRVLQKGVDTSHGNVKHLVVAREPKGGQV